MKQLFRHKPLMVILTLALAAPAFAQSVDPNLEVRMRKLEAEVSALQRVVFPGGDGRFFPQIQPTTGGATVSGTPATTPSADMLTRMDALEGHVSKLTAQVEEDRNRIDKLETRLAAVEAGKTAAATGEPVVVTPTPKPVIVTPPAPKPVTPVAKPVDPSAKRLAAVRAIAKPQTDDPGDDEYSYGFRLWEAKFQPEAQQQLKLFLTKYPKHARVSYARNLLGRSYLDEGNPREAASWFLQNYKADPKGDRAPDSLLYLGESMRQLKDTNRACVAVDQFARDFPKEAAGRLKAQYEATRGGLKCPA
ncbi:MAG: tetratricopeptide repeat protein [Novosphingobium sp.]|nr:tetratricopeptide repeat protein [Novosphingobium sp.]